MDAQRRVTRRSNDVNPFSVKDIVKDLLRYGSKPLLQFIHILGAIIIAVGLDELVLFRKG
jgi:hypothetical protein